MSQVNAANILWGLFEIYDHKTGRFYFRRDTGELTPEELTPWDELNRRRDELLGPAFRITWPSLPSNAKLITT